MKNGLVFPPSPPEASGLPKREGDGNGLLKEFHIAVFRIKMMDDNWVN
jgi:hypothetical protein